MDREEFDCGVCRRIFFEPLSLTCGHTFCRPCLGASLLHSSQCPLCRSPCHLNVQTAVPSILLTHVLQRSYPEEVKARAVEAASEALESQHARLSLFIQPGLLSQQQGPLLPGAPFALHAFEPRYTLMVDRCWENGTMFGVQDSPDHTLGVTVKLTSLRRVGPGDRRVVLGVTVGRYRLAAPPTPTPGELGLQGGAATFFGDELPDALTMGGGLEEGDFVTAAGLEAAGVLEGSGGGGGGGTGPSPITALVVAHIKALTGEGGALTRMGGGGGGGGGGGNTVGPLAAASVALRDLCLGSVAPRLLAALGDDDARSLHAVVGTPPPPTAPPQQASFWMASAFALTPGHRRAALETVSTLTRLLIVYGVLCTAERVAVGRKGGGGGSGSNSSKGGAPAAAATDAAATTANQQGQEQPEQPELQPPPLDRLWDLQRVCPQDSLVVFSKNGGEGGDDPDEDLLRLFPPTGGMRNAVARGALKVLRVGTRVMRRREVYHFLVLLAVLYAMYYGRNHQNRGAGTILM